MLCITKLIVSWSSVTPERVCETKDQCELSQGTPAMLCAQESRKVKHELQMLCSVGLGYEGDTDMLNTTKQREVYSNG